MRGVGGAGGFVLAAASFVALAVSRFACADDAESRIVRFRYEKAAPGLWEAVQGARARLAEPRCQQLLSNLSDGSGRKLAEVLSASGRSVDEWLDGVVFLRAVYESHCGRTGVLAFTRPATPVVFVAAPSFGRADPLLREATVIHELLHSLGLGENPPPSGWITRQVLDLCGRSAHSTASSRKSSDR